MKAEDVMTTRVITVAENQTRQQAARLLCNVSRYLISQPAGGHEPANKLKAAVICKFLELPFSDIYPAKVAQSLHLVFAKSRLAQDVTIIFAVHDTLPGCICDAITL